MAKINPTVRKAIYSRDGNRCLQCGSVKSLTIDHIMPLSLGGLNTSDNYQTLCAPCNTRKGNMIYDLRGAGVLELSNKVRNAERCLRLKAATIEKQLIAKYDSVVVASNSDFPNKEKILHNKFLEGHIILCALFGVRYNTYNFHY